MDAIIGRVLVVVVGAAVIGISLLTKKRDSNPVTVEENKNLILNGKNYSGRFIRNRNSDIYCEQSDDLEIIGCHDMTAKIFGSSVKATTQSNCTLLAKASTINMKSDKNIVVEAENVFCVFEDNLNMNYNGSDASKFQSRFSGNRHCHVTGKCNNIVARNNRHLTVKGDNNRLEISDTRSHDIQPDSNRNTLTISRKDGSEYINFDIQYVGIAVIEKLKYRLGIFNFTIAKSVNKVSVTLQDTGDVIYSIVETTTNKIVMKVKKNGRSQTLELIGDRVDAVGLNFINIHC